MSKKQAEIYDQMTSTFPPQVIEEWTKAIEKWEDDPKASNPYEEPQCCETYHLEYCTVSTNTFETATTLQDVRLELAKEDAAQATRAGTDLPKLSLTGFFTTGFELEDRQCV